MIIQLKFHVLLFYLRIKIFHGFKHCNNILWWYVGHNIVYSIEPHNHRLLRNFKIRFHVIFNFFWWAALRTFVYPPLLPRM